MIPCYRGLTDISILNCFVHVRYVVSALLPVTTCHTVSPSPLPPPPPQDVSGNHLSDISALNALPQLLTIKADNNQLTSAKLQEVQCCTLFLFHRLCCCRIPSFFCSCGTSRWPVLPRTRLSQQRALLTPSWRPSTWQVRVAGSLTRSFRELIHLTMFRSVCSLQATRLLPWRV